MQLRYQACLPQTLGLLLSLGSVMDIQWGSILLNLEWYFTIESSDGEANLKMCKF